MRMLLSSRLRETVFIFILTFFVLSLISVQRIQAATCSISDAVYYDCWICDDYDSDCGCCISEHIDPDRRNSPSASYRWCSDVCTPGAWKGCKVEWRVTYTRDVCLSGQCVQESKTDWPTGNKNYCDTVRDACGGCGGGGDGGWPRGPTATPGEAPSPTRRPKPTPTSQENPTATPAPQCYGPCNPDNPECPIECPVCKPDPNNPDQNVCQPPACGEPCSPTVPNQCPEECPLCPEGVENPVCRPDCDLPCTSPEECPQQCPICAVAPGGGSTCQAPTPTPTATPTLLPTPTPTTPACGAPCDPAIADQCPQQCPVCGKPSKDEPPVCRTCDCDGMDISGTIAKGHTVMVTAYAKVQNPQTNSAEARYMVFHVEKDGVEIAVSDQIQVTGPTRTIDSETGEPIDRYGASWSFTIPDTGAYRIFAQITCGIKQSGQAVQEARGEKGFFDRIIDFFGSLFGRLLGRRSRWLTPTPSPPAKIEAQSAPPDVTSAAPTGSTLKLGTFRPGELTPSPTPTPTPYVEEKCKEVLFAVTY